MEEINALDLDLLIDYFENEILVILPNSSKLDIYCNTVKILKIDRLRRLVGG